MRFDQLITGRLLRRYKRFLADVELSDGSVVTVHCPNTGAMTGCAEPGSPVWLSVNASKSRKYPHTWELVQTSTGMACVHSARANQVVQQGIGDGVVPGLEAYPVWQREVRYHDNSRIDLLLEGAAGRVFVEVKSVTLCRTGGCGVFPDAVSERARKHVLALRAVRDRSTRVLLFFCVMHNGIESVSAAADIDPHYRDVLGQAMADGLEVMAWRAAVTPEGIALAKALPFSLDMPV